MFGHVSAQCGSFCPLLWGNRLFSCSPRLSTEPRLAALLLERTDVYTPSKTTITHLQEKAGTFSLFKKEEPPTSVILFDAVDKLGPLSNGLLESRAYRTHAHEQLYEILLRKAQSLVANHYMGTRGVSSAVIVGAKGIGKTTVLSSFVNLCPLFEPKIVPVYVTMNHIGTKDHPLAKNTLAENVINQVVKQGIPVPSHGVERVRELLMALAEADKHLLLLVDELDQLYRLDPASSIGECALQTLWELAFLGDQNSGRASTLICGSSAMLPLLITRNTDDPTFPLLSRAPSLNGTKYNTKCISASPPTDLAAVASIAGLDLAQHLPAVRQLAFVAGATASDVERMFLETEHNSLSQSTLPEESLMGYKTLHNENRGEIRQVLLNKLCEKNKGLLLKLLRDKKIDTQAVRTTSWETDFKPLLFAEARECCKSLGPAVQDNTLTHLLHLSDRSWIMLDGALNSAPERIYPFTLLQATAHYLQEKDGQRVTDTLRSYWNEARASEEYEQALSLIAKAGVFFPQRKTFNKEIQKNTLNKLY